MILLSLAVILAFGHELVSGNPVYSSSVFYERGLPSLPIRYIPLEYGAPYPPEKEIQYSPYVAEPINLVVPYGPPHCSPPCSYETVETVPGSNAKIVTYNPTIPRNLVIPSVKNDQNGYEYSYAVFDDSTGDQKAQHELSDGGVVRGQYSLIQPDGYIREVNYVADDETGFNAVVKNFLPKLENIKFELKDENIHSTDDPNCHGHEVVKIEETDNNGLEVIVEPALEEVPKKDSSEKIKIEVPKEEKPNQNTSTEKPKETEKTTETTTKKNNSEEDKSNEKDPEIVSSSAEVTTDVIPEIETPYKENEIIIRDESGENKVVISFRDLIRCSLAIMKKLNTHYGVPGHVRDSSELDKEKPKSPLTYIILPSARKENKNPC